MHTCWIKVRIYCTFELTVPFSRLFSTHLNHFISSFFIQFFYKLLMFIRIQNNGSILFLKWCLIFLNHTVIAKARVCTEDICIYFEFFSACTLSFTGSFAPFRAVAFIHHGEVHTVFNKSLSNEWVMSNECCLFICIWWFYEPFKGDVWIILKINSIE